MSQDQRPPLNVLRAGESRAAAPPADAAAVYEDEWWIEHVEGEADGALEEDLRLLLRNSRSDRAKRAAWLRARAAIKNADDVGSRLAAEREAADDERVHDAIMAAIESAQIESPSPRQAPAERASGSAPAVAALLALLGSLAWAIAQSPFSAEPTATADVREGLRGEADETEDERLVSRLATAVGARPGAFVDTVLGYELEADVLLQAAERRIARLDPEDARRLIQALQKL